MRLIAAIWQRKWLLAMFVVVILAALFWWRFNSGDETKNRYKTQAVDRGDIRQVITANGTLNPVVLVNVGTQVSGTIKALYTDFNERVTPGQVLAELDPSLFRATLAQSQANMLNAKANLMPPRTLTSFM